MECHSGATHGSCDLQTNPECTASRQAQAAVLDVTGKDSDTEETINKANTDDVTATMDESTEGKSIQEVGSHSTSAQAVIGAENFSSNGRQISSHTKLPVEIEKPLQEVQEEFKTEAMAKVNDIVCTQPGLNPLVSIAEAPNSGEHVIRMFMTIFTLALQTMAKQVSIIKQFYRKKTEENKSQADKLEMVTRELAEANEELSRLRAEKANLMQQSSNSEDKQQLIKELEPGSPAPSLGQNTQGFVRVEHVDKNSTSEDADVKLRVEEVSQRESELERKISKLKSTQKQLVEANTEWEKHCREITDQHEKQFKAQADDLRESQRRCREQRDKIKQYEHQVTEQQQKLIQITEQFEEQVRESDLKLNNMSEDLARKEAAYQSLMERRHSNSSPLLLQPLTTNQQLSAHNRGLEQRVHELERQVQELRCERGQLTPPLNLNTENRQQPGSPRRQSEPRLEMKGASADPRSSAEQRSAQVKQYKTQISVLQAQITAFKEDFDIERADKERAQARLSEMQDQFKRISKENSDLKRLVEQKDRESGAVRNQNEFVRQQYTQKCRELESERGRTKELEAKVSRLQSQVRVYHQQQEASQHQFTYAPTTSPTAHELYIARPPHAGSGVLRWRCPSCTYDNIQQRVTCEMCGQKAPHVQSVGNIVPDTPHLLARAVDQADGNNRAYSRKLMNGTSAYYERDVEEDIQFLTNMD